MKTREEAISLLYEWVQSESLRKHMLCVEAAMRAYAKKLGENEEAWGICGLLHDFDYEKFPAYDAAAQSGHPYEGIKVLKERGYSEEIIEAILGHALYSGIPRQSNMAKYLFACDELCGFIVACAYMRPDKFESLTGESVMKRLKDKRFAAKVSREDIDLGVSETNVDKKEHIDFIIKSLKPLQLQIFGQAMG
ncbi:MAG: HAD family hydrolase [Candidatus Yanofskybacteria bacterium RIFCSPHIGHO2_02_FULL_41_11]|uniref:HAD family hydrolase n=1 Tax=Candidatus Yanofskybacteria bacterium RIFCSPHIGHO2_02_FULL_41_11 TaxID=1802675 RepID=A0A1F8FCA2_9BACT|nr:MAG: HAD family hydrolase [Candidatus Yanofskybacteria bacterium RIFCSPHIGHO2_02_FULL_41_11]